MALRKSRVRVPHAPPRLTRRRYFRVWCASAFWYNPRMFTCRTCNISKPASAFGRRSDTKKRRTQCGDCLILYQKEWRSRPGRMQQVAASNLRGRLRIAGLISAYKTAAGCSICGERDPVCLDFHHVGEKEICIGQATQLGWSWERLEAEIKQCEVLCANHHRKRHAQLRIAAVV